MAIESGSLMSVKKLDDDKKKKKMKHATDATLHSNLFALPCALSDSPKACHFR